MERNPGRAPDPNPFKSTPPGPMFSPMSVVPTTTEDVLRIANTFPATPQIILEVGALLQSPSVDSREITSRLKRDQALTSRLIRIANSAVFAGTEPVASVEDAISLIGFQEVHRLVGFHMLRQIGDADLLIYGIPARRFVENSLFVALLMEELAVGAQEDPRTCYTIGLLRSLGKVCLDRHGRGCPPERIPRLSDDLGIAQLEMEVFGITGNEAGAGVLESWRFPHEFTAAIRDHYAPAGLHLPLTHLLNLAASVADILGYGIEGEWRYWLDSDEVYHKAGLDPKRANSIIDHSLEAFHRLIAFVH
jgi:HD-like signal output (HDOD) protein